LACFPTDFVPLDRAHTTVDTPEVMVIKAGLTCNKTDCLNCADTSGKRAVNVRVFFSWGFFFTNEHRKIEMSLQKKHGFLMKNVFNLSALVLQIKCKKKMWKIKIKINIMLKTKY
jgi:hypothetical protein